MVIALTGFAWGLAEATLFFLVPDILLSWVVFRREGHIVTTYLLTLLGALCGGAMIYMWGSHDPEGVLRLMQSVPAVDAALIEQVRNGLHDLGMWAIPAGALQGVPYKLYAASAAGAGIDLPLFLLVSIPARLFRWVMAGVGIYLLNALVLHKLSRQNGNRIFAGCWIGFYCCYFYIMGI